MYVSIFFKWCRVTKHNTIFKIYCRKKVIFFPLKKVRNQRYWQRWHLWLVLNQHWTLLNAGLIWDECNTISLFMLHLCMVKNHSLQEVALLWRKKKKIMDLNMAIDKELQHILTKYIIYWRGCRKKISKTNTAGSHKPWWRQMFWS